MTDPKMNAANFRQIGRKVVAIGRNYRDHAAELNNPVPTQPMMFMKSTSSYVSDGQNVIIPKGCEDMNQEVELGVVISSTMSSVSASNAMNHVGGYVVALDMTARDWQNDAKKKGHPWFLAKSFDTSCPISKFIPITEIADVGNVGLRCTVNDVVKQDGNTKDMVFSVPTLLEYVSKFVTLEAGDVLLTGTPAGVCSVVDGDTIKCEMSVDGKIVATLSVGVKNA